MYRIEVSCSHPDLGAIEIQLYDYEPYRRNVWQESLIVYYQQAHILRAHVRRLDRAQMLVNADAVYGAIYSCIAECRFHEEQQIKRKGRSILDSVVDAMLGRRPSDD